MSDQTDPTELTPEEWQQYLKNAITALHQNPRNQRALKAVQQANNALSAYDEAEAASPGERLTAGVVGGAKGLGQAAVDVVRGPVTALMHPIQTIENLPKVPGAIVQGLTSDNPETVARTVGNVGTVLSGFAQPGRGLQLVPARGAGPVAALRTARAAGGAVAAPVRAAGAILRRPGLRNQLLELQVARELRAAAPEVPPPAAAAAEPAVTVPRPPGAAAGGEIAPSGFEASPATQEATADIVQATRDLAAGKISQADYDVAVRFARGEPLPPEQGALQAIPGTGGRGLTVEGPPTPAAPTAPTAAEMVTGRSNAPVQLPGGGQVMPAATGVAPSATELAHRAQPMTAPWRRPQGPVGAPAPATPQVAPWQRPMTLEDLRTLPEAPAGPSSLSELSTGKTLPYYPRGGQVEQALPPPPGGPSGLGGPARSVGQIADEMEAQIDLAARLGQEPNVQNLPSLLQRRGLTPQQIQAVGKELLRRSLRRKAG